MTETMNKRNGLQLPQDRLDKWAKDTPQAVVAWIVANPHSAFDIASTAHAKTFHGCVCPLHQQAKKLNIRTYENCDD